MTNQIIKVRRGPAPKPPVTGDLRAHIGELLEVYMLRCEGDTNPSVHTFGLFLVQNCTNLYDTSSEF